MGHLRCRGRRRHCAQRRADRRDIREKCRPGTRSPIAPASGRALPALAKIAKSRRNAPSQATAAPAIKSSPDRRVLGHDIAPVARQRNALRTLDLGERDPCIDHARVKREGTPQAQCRLGAPPRLLLCHGQVVVESCARTIGRQRDRRHRWPPDNRLWRRQLYRRGSSPPGAG